MENKSLATERLNGVKSHEFYGVLKTSLYTSSTTLKHIDIKKIIDYSLVAQKNSVTIGMTKHTA